MSLPKGLGESRSAATNSKPVSSSESDAVLFSRTAAEDEVVVGAEVRAEAEVEAEAAAEAEVAAEAEAVAETEAVADVEVVAESDGPKATVADNSKLFPNGLKRLTCRLPDVAHIVKGLPLGPVFHLSQLELHESQRPVA